MFETELLPSVDYSNRPEDALTRKIIGSAIEVHRTLGPGLLESTYETCLIFELQQEGLKVERQKELPVVYKNVKLDCGYRLDVVVEDKIIIEIKSVDRLMAIHESQFLSYLRISKFQVGLLINFNVKILKQGVRRLIK